MVPSQSFESPQQSTCFYILSGVRFLRYYYYYFAWFPFKILNCNLLGEAVVCSLWTPTQLYKNGPWADNIALLRDKEPSQPRLGSSPCEGTPFSVSDFMYAPLVCLSACINGPQVHPGFLYFRTHRGGVASFHCSTKWASGNHTAHSSCGMGPLATGDQCITRGWISCTLSPLGVR